MDINKRMLLICADRCDLVENSVKRAGWKLSRVTDGWTALSRARSETFAAILFIPSPGAMTVETALMMRSVNASTPILILRNVGSETRGQSLGNVATAIPHAAVIEARGLENYLQSLESTTSTLPH